MAWFGQGTPEAVLGPFNGPPPGFGGKVKLVVKSLVIEWLGLDGGSGGRFWASQKGVLQDPEEK